MPIIVWACRPSIAARLKIVRFLHDSMDFDHRARRPKQNGTVSERRSRFFFVSCAGAQLRAVYRVYVGFERRLVA